jgi:uncharacterized protein (TIGR00255 family)
MVQSMTGFATSQLEWQLNVATSVPITMTIKVLNSRFFETNFRMPHVLASLEQVMAQRCKMALKRGSVTVTVHLGSTLALRTLVMPSLDVIQQHVNGLRIMKDACKIAQDVTLSDLIQLPHLFETIEEPLSNVFADYLTCQFEQLLTEVVIARKREGEHLRRDLVLLMDTIGVYIEELAPRAELISRERRDRFMHSIAASIAVASSDVQQQHIQALYQHLHTIDTHEEIIRLRAHHQTFLATLEDVDMQKGKKLDFILQELFREINTLSAKLADVKSIEPVLTIKTRLEQAREQIQNVV